jgi:hypothetical protein
MEQLTGASRQVSATARQIAASAVSLATVASRLEGTRGQHVQPGGPHDGGPGEQGGHARPDLLVAPGQRER